MNNLVVEDNSIILAICKKYNMEKDSKFKYIVEDGGNSCTDILSYGGDLYQLKYFSGCFYPYLIKFPQSFEGFGDVNPIEHGGQWVKRTDKSEYYVVTLDRDSEDNTKLYLGTCLVDLYDSWINRSYVCSYSDLEKYHNNNDTALAVVSYYGVTNCGGSLEEMTEEQAKERLKNLGIEVK